MLVNFELNAVSFCLFRCGHCKKLAPEWKKAANNLKGKVKLGHVDCDAEKVIYRLQTESIFISLHGIPSLWKLYLLRSEHVLIKCGNARCIT